MQVEHHDLHQEFPGLSPTIHTLKVSSPHFARLFDEYNALTEQIEQLELVDVPVDDFTIEDMKKKRVRLKDELYTLLVANTH